MTYDVTGKCKEAIGHFKEGMSLLASGPWDYYLDRLVLHSNALLDKFAPFARGQRIQITGHVPCSDGWSGHHWTLREGAPGTVRDVDYDKRGFVFDVVMDDEVWIDKDGKKYPSTSRHTFALREKYLKRLEKQT